MEGHGMNFFQHSQLYTNNFFLKSERGKCFSFPNFHLNASNIFYKKQKMGLAFSQHFQLHTNNISFPNWREWDAFISTSSSTPSFSKVPPKCWIFGVENSKELFNSSAQGELLIPVKSQRNKGSKELQHLSPKFSLCCGCP